MGLSKLQQQLKKKEKERKQAGAKASPLSAEAKSKSARDAVAFICGVCRAPFPVNSKAAQLAEHAANKHAKLPEAQSWPGLAAMREAEGK
jgi:hypothetical protein